VCGFSVLDNHLHVLLRLDLSRAKLWSPEEIVRRWLLLCPPKDRYGKRVVVTAAWLTKKARDSKWIEECRGRLSDLGWFMKSLKEPISRRDNRDDKCTGAFGEGRFKSIAILDPASLLATCAYIDLNPIAAGIAATPEKSPHTSVKSRVDHSVDHRVDHCAVQGKLEALQKNSPYFSKVNCERGHWLFPTEDCRDPNVVGLAGMLQGISLTGYLQLIDWSSRLIRPGKVNLPQSVPSILNRLQTDATTWQATLEKLLGPNQQIGTYFGNSSRLNEVAAQRGTKYLKNVTGRN
jgi:hypothetical protein